MTKCPASRKAGLALVTVLLATSSVYSADQLLPGKKLVIRTPAFDASKNKLVHLGKDPSVAIGAAGGTGDPQCSGASGGGGFVRVIPSGGGPELSIQLPCENWTTNPANALYKYSDPSGATCKVVLVKNAVLVKAVCKGPQVAIGVSGAMAPVAIMVALNQQLYCTEFGGTVAKDGADGQLFVAKNAPQSAACGFPDFALSLDPTESNTTLGTTTHYTVTIASTGGYAGDVDLSAIDVPSSWTAQVVPPTVTLSANGMTTADLAITVPTNGAAISATPGVSGNGSPGTHAANAMLTVANEVIIPFAAAGIGAGNHNLPATMSINLGTTLRFVNYDSVGHRVHSDGGLGFPHQGASMGNGQEYDVTPGEVGSYRFYCHDHGEATGATDLTVN